MIVKVNEEVFFNNYQEADPPETQYNQKEMNEE